jgi:hypothetical protein
MLGKEFPIQKNDVQYNPETQEVTLEREKFDRLVKYVGELVGRVEAAEDSRDVARYRARRAEGILELLEASVQSGATAITDWVGQNSVKQLSERSGIPYATCHRIVTTRLDKTTVGLDQFLKMVEVVGGSETPVASKKKAAGPLVNVLRFSKNAPVFTAGKGQAAGVRRVRSPRLSRAKLKQHGKTEKA